jgi:hypothetical protein
MIVISIPSLWYPHEICQHLYQVYIHIGNENNWVEEVWTIVLYLLLHL